MKALEYIIAIDFGTANTKFVCWNIKEEKTIPLFIGEHKEGIAPTSIIYNDKFYSNFFDKPSSMEQIGDLSVFKYYAKTLFINIIRFNPFLCYLNDNNQEWNFIVVISYPSSWDKNEAFSLLKIIQQFFPPVRYAIREDIALRQLLTYNDKQGVIVDLGASKTAAYNYQSMKILYGFSLSQIETLMTEKALIAFNNKETINLQLLSSIQKEDNTKTDYILRRLKEKYQITEKSEELSNSIEEKWLKESIIELIPSIETTFRRIRKEFGNQNIIYVSGGLTNCFSEVLSSVFTNQPKIETIGLFGICNGLIQYFIKVYEKASELKKTMSLRLLDDSVYSRFNYSCSKMANDIFSEICVEKGKKELSGYINRTERTSYNDLTEDVKHFLNDRLPKSFDYTISKQLGSNIASIINKLCKEELEGFEFPDKTTELILNDISDYLSVLLYPIHYSHDSLIAELFNFVYSPGYFDVTLELERNYNERDRVFKKLMDYFKNNTLINFIPRIAWAIVEEDNLLMMYSLDLISKNCNSIVHACERFNVYDIDLRNLFNVINYSINIIVNDRYELVDGKLSEKEAFITQNWKLFDFNKYNVLRKIVKEEQIELKKDIVDLSKITIYELYGKYPKLYETIKTFFNLNIHDIEIKVRTLTNNSIIVYDMILAQYLSFRKTR